jgi:hypothetical protein
MKRVINMSDNLELLIEKLRDIREKYGNSLQKAATPEDVELLNKVVKKKFKIELSPVYQFILLNTNGFNENGVFLYGNKTALIQGYTDRYLGGLVEENETWHGFDEKLSKYLFYAESDSYLFGQSLENKVFTCYAKESFGDYLVFETSNDSDFFEKIFKLAINDGFYLE